MRKHFLASFLHFLTVSFSLFWKFPLNKVFKIFKKLQNIVLKIFPLWVINFLSSCARKTNYFLWYLTPMNWSQAQKSFPSIFWLVLGILAPITSILAPNIAKRMVFTREFPAMLISRDCMLSYHWFHLSIFCDVIFWVFPKFAIFDYFLMFFIFFWFQFR